MNFFKKNSSNNFIVLHLIFLYFALSDFPIDAQQVIKLIEPSKSVELYTPLKLCFQNQDSKILTVNFASDNFQAIFVPSHNGKITKINLINNSIIWISNLGGEIVSDLVFEDGKIYLITELLEVFPKKNNNETKQTVNYILWSLDAKTGFTNWQLPFTSNNTVFLSSYKDKILLITKEGTLNFINKNDAQKKINNSFTQNFSSLPSFFENKIYIGTKDNLISTISVDDGKVISNIPTLLSPASILIAAKDKLLWGDRKGFVNLFDTKNNNRLWSVRYGGEISSLTLIPNRILVSSLDNFVYLISLHKGKKVWKKRLAGRIFGRPLIVNNFAVFVTSVDNNAVILNLETGKMVNQIPLADIGFILSTPLILNNFLVFTTNKGIFAFAEAKTNCTQH